MCFDVMSRCKYKSELLILKDKQALGDLTADKVVNFGINHGLTIARLQVFISRLDKMISVAEICSSAQWVSFLRVTLVRQHVGRCRLKIDSESLLLG